MAQAVFEPGTRTLKIQFHNKFIHNSGREEIMATKYIFVTGGVVSSLGKSLAAASLGCLLETRRPNVNLLKFYPYPNLLPRTQPPLPPAPIFPPPTPPAPTPVAR